MKPFRAPSAVFEDLDASTFSNLLAAASDIAFIVDSKGVIEDVAIGIEAPAVQGDVQAWVGRAFEDTVSKESLTKVRDLVSRAEPTPTRWRQINHPLSGGRELPMQYCAANAGSGHVVVLGRSLEGVEVLQQRLVEAQQSLEQDYWRRRQVETRYRLLFQVASEAVLIVDAENQRIIEANPSAETLLDHVHEALVGQNLRGCFDESSRDDVSALLATLRSSGGAEAVEVKLSGSDTRVRVSASLLSQSGAVLYLVRLAPDDVREVVPSTGHDKANLVNVMENGPDAVVITDERGQIQSANRAFLELAELGALDQARGQPIERWVGRTNVDIKVLISNLRQYGTLRHFTTRLRGEYGAEADVEISAATVRDAERFAFGFVIRDVSRRQITPEPANAQRTAPRSIEQLTELVGRVPLKEVIRESSDVIERLCIEAALELTNDNRASAAELLGLSRQSLYVKLRRHGLMNSDTDASSSSS